MVGEQTGGNECRRRYSKRKKNMMEEVERQDETELMNLGRKVKKKTKKKCKEKECGRKLKLKRIMQGTKK